MKQLTIFKSAYDKRNTDPKKDYGIHSVQCYMVLIGKKGATHFTFSTGILLPKTIEEYIKDGRAKYELTSYGYHFLNKPMGYDVGYHSPKPGFEGQKIYHPTKIVKSGKELKDYKFKKVGKEPPVCDYIGVPCFSDGSALRAEEWMDIFVNEGSEKIWGMLKEDYIERFGKD